ncbi:glucosamine-6-phosphate deaminase [Salibacterium halotolerans]|uniref:Glucosamine-6-phosphate deaminase n=1 Tax=Salibacterium halotolerans TaxID=1884432 RepID=A0A1I5L842_9BACI|nr:glucosamine-6-phosphate deaminase [Salibacterium halotolerans]SFO93427.1 glucosamine-6-phosphate deaminase [Salibacterium halotolerans]
MEVIAVKNEQEMSEKAASIIAAQITDNPDIVLGLATGGTPEGTYREWIRNAAGLPLSRLQTFNLDEYAGLSPNHPNSYHRYMEEKLFRPLELRSGQTHLPKGDADDLQAEARRYEQDIQEGGGIDLQLLGIGENGHIGFNEPGTSFDSRTHIVKLKPSTREANARFFDDKEEVPYHAVTMGIQTIMESRHILLLASGTRKQEAVTNLLEGKINEDFPASVLQNHPYVTIIADEAALSGISFNKWISEGRERETR